MCRLSGLCREKEKNKSYQFFNLLHDFVCVGVYQMRKFTNNFVNILDIIKKIKSNSTAAFVFYSSLKLTAFFSV